VHLHDTTVVAASIHAAAVAAIFLGALATLYEWFPRILGVALIVPLGWIHFALTVAFFGAQLALATFPATFAPGLREAVHALASWQQRLAWANAGVQILFLANVVYALARRRSA
jgi:heme/copper-type cytochrome/quinol oxidase subunit 1